MKPFGIDISKWQGTGLDYSKMRANTRFVGMRAGISYAYEDPTFGPNWNALKGHNRIAYHVVYPAQDPIRQADWFLEIINSYGFDPKTDRLALDVELHQSQSRERITYVTEQMMDYLKTKTGREPIIYSATWFTNSYMNISGKLKAADWWLATYPPKTSPDGTEHPGPPLLPNGVSTWLIHQTSERGIGANVGVSGRVDTNRWNGTDQDMQAYFGRYELGFPIIVNPGEDDPELPEPLYLARVNTFPDRLHVRKAPSRLSHHVRWLYDGDIVPVYLERSGWSKISSTADEWVMSKYIIKTENSTVTGWSQRDPRWANDKMGSSNITLGQQGCLVTATSWLLHRLGIDIDPRRYNLLASTRGGYLHPNLMYWLFPEVMWGPNGAISQAGIRRAEYLFFNGSGWRYSVDQILNDGRDALACVDMIPGGAFNQHWVTIFERAGNDYLFMDPWYGDVERISRRYFNVYKVVSYRR